MYTESLNLLAKYCIPASLIGAYKEPHRYYHTFKHINTMLMSAKRRGILDEKMHMAILFHDIVYDPLADGNEEKSAELFMQYSQSFGTLKDRNDVYSAILSTKDHVGHTEFAFNLCYLDLEILHTDSTLEDFMAYDYGIFKEYQHYDYGYYRTKRIEALLKLDAKPEYLSYFKKWEPKIAMYPGSFNPFHIGHLDILHQSEAVFDKVIIARGLNPDKNIPFEELPEELKYHQVDTYYNLMTDYMDDKEYPLTVVRGLRNASDFEAEKVQLRYLNDLKPGIKVAYFISAAHLEHVSSSSIRMLRKYGKGEDYTL